jgi:hypothetical protein
MPDIQTMVANIEREDFNARVYAYSAAVATIAGLFGNERHGVDDFVYL